MNSLKRLSKNIFILGEGIISVPERWMKEAREDIQKYVANYASELLHLKIAYVIQEIKDSKENIEKYKDNNKVVDLLKKKVEQEEASISTWKKLLSYVGKKYGAYLLDDIEYINFDKINLSNFSIVNRNIEFFLTRLKPEESKYLKDIPDKKYISLPDIEVIVDLLSKVGTQGTYISDPLNNTDKIYIWNKERLSFPYEPEKQAIDNFIKKYVEDYMSTFEHELIHYVQSRILDPSFFYKDIDVIAYKKSGEYYYQTEV